VDRVNVAKVKELSLLSEILELGYSTWCISEWMHFLGWGLNVASEVGKHYKAARVYDDFSVNMDVRWNYLDIILRSVSRDRVMPDIKTEQSSL
jgi:hypothetical protein